jgi:hypothetical protein
MGTRAMNADPHIRVQLVSDPIYLSGARELVGSVAKRLGFDDLQCSKIALAVDEALCNIIRHGYDRAADKPDLDQPLALEERRPAGPRAAGRDRGRGPPGRARGA